MPRRFAQRRMLLGAVVLISGPAPSLSLAQTAPAPAQPTASAPAIEPSFLDRLATHAEKLRDFAASPLAKSFLDQAAALKALPAFTARTIYRDRSRGLALTKPEFDALPKEEQENLKPRECDEEFFYCTGYGSPLIYVRPLELLGSKFGVASLAGKKTLDFGYGMIGQVRMTALLGAEAHGVDVEPVLRAMYSLPGDTGPIGDSGGSAGGSVVLHHGQWPADESLTRAVGTGYDLIISKNTLKRGYIHPARETKPEWLVHLGVSDEQFVRAMHGALKPGGLVMVYNICPPQAPPDKDYIPWADGEFPFDRALIEKQGFEVLAWDERDMPAVAEIFTALGYNEGKRPDELIDQYPTWYTVLRKK